MVHVYIELLRLKFTDISEMERARNFLLKHRITQFGTDLNLLTIYVYQFVPLRYLNLLMDEINN